MCVRDFLLMSSIYVIITVHRTIAAWSAKKARERERRKLRTMQTSCCAKKKKSKREKWNNLHLEKLVPLFKCCFTRSNFVSFLNDCCAIIRENHFTQHCGLIKFLIFPSSNHHCCWWAREGGEKKLSISRLIHFVPLRHLSSFFSFVGTFFCSFHSSSFLILRGSFGKISSMLLSVNEWDWADYFHH